MIQDFLNLKYNIYLNNSHILEEVLNDLKLIINSTQDNILIAKVENIIIKVKKIINENLKNVEIIRNDLQVLIKKFEEIKINNNINNQELKLNQGKYIGQIKNGKAEGKGICFFINGDKYEGDFKNDKQEGKGIYYWKNGERYEGDWRNGIMEGKGINFYINGDRYEGEWKRGKKEGNGIYYFNNGDRRMGDYYNNEPIGKHVKLSKDSIVSIINY